jgi:tRNA(Ile)-lysidine synthase
MLMLVDRVAAYILRNDLLHPGDSVVVGVSGGADSLCLFHLLLQLAPHMQLHLHAAHLNHALRGAESDADAAFVGSLAGVWDVPHTIDRVNVRALADEHHLSLEEAARQARYAFLAGVAQRIGATLIAVGHHADDQAETVLMHFLRGSGVAGLRGMLPRMALSDYRALSERAGGVGAELLLVRPLLGVRRAEIETYCSVAGLEPRIDRSNADTTFHRNRLRHELLPLLRQVNPAIDEVLVHTASVMAGDFEVLSQATQDALRRVEVGAASVPAQTVDEVRFGRAEWRMLPIGLQRATVRAAVGRLRRTLRNINWEHIDGAVRIGREGETGDSATIAAGLALTVNYDVLRIGPEDALAPGPGPRVDGWLPLRTPGDPRLEAGALTPIGRGWQVRIEQVSGAEVAPAYAANADPWTAYLDAGAVGAQLALRPRRPGDRFQPLGLGGHSARVNEFMINVKVPAADRAGWPLLVGSAGIAWLCGLRVDARAAIGPATQSVWRVRFER